MSEEQPIRVQLRRTKGWRMPENTISVARPGKFGNPFTLDGCRDAGYSGSDAAIAYRCVEAFLVWLGPSWRNNWDGQESEARRAALIAALPSIRGKNLACWCPPNVPCHADALIKLANPPSEVTP